MVIAKKHLAVVIRASRAGAVSNIDSERGGVWGRLTWAQVKLLGLSGR